MNYIATHKKKILTLATLCVLFGASAVLYIHTVQQQFVAKTKTLLSAQETQLTQVAQATIKDVATGEVDAIIRDCSVKNRTLFDTQLGNLQQLHGQQLIEIEQLFGACGDYFALKKAVMVLQLESSYQSYANYVALLQSAAPSEDIEQYKLDSWKQLVELEKKQSELSLHLVAVQGEIISSLRDNVPLSSDVVQTLSVEGQKTRDELFSLSSQIDTLARQLQLL